jgi:hypothetical protein
MMVSMGRAKAWAEELASRGYGDVAGGICLSHVVDASLAHDLAAEVDEGDCVLCGATNDHTILSIESLMDVFMESFRFFYKTTDELPWDSEEGVYWGEQTDTGEAVYDIAGSAFEQDVLDDALQLIADAIGYENDWTPWGSQADTDDLDYAWEQFALTVKHKSRFVFIQQHSERDSVSVFLDQLSTYVDQQLGLISTLPRGAAVYRGRLCERPGDVDRTARALGPAPSSVAAANRMSPQGISMFYGSSDAITAVAEIAGHGVEPLAVIGRFVTNRDLTVVDFTARPTTPSPFDRARRREFRMSSFLGSFVEAITAPVIPDGRQHVEYVPTQIVTEYLRRVADVTLDGFVLPSSQTGRPTYVLFVDADDVAEHEDPGTPSKPEQSLVRDLLDYMDKPPALTLNAHDIETYRVTRTYGAEPWMTCGR